MRCRRICALGGLLSLLTPLTAFADTPEVWVRALVAPIVGPSTPGGEGPRNGMRADLGGDLRAGRFQSWLAVGFWHVGGRTPVGVGSEPSDPNCVDPVVQGCLPEELADEVSPEGRVATNPPDHSARQPNTSLADSTLGAGVRVVDIDRLTVMPRLDFVLPTSAYSRKQTLIFAAQLGADMELRPSDRVAIGVSARFDRSFHSEAVPGVDLATGRRELPPFGFRTAGSRLSGREITRIAAANTASSVHVAALPRVRIAADVWFDLGFGLTHAWTYDLPTVDPQGSFVAGVRERSQVTTATAAVAWRPTWGPLGLEVRLGAATTGYPRTSDNKALRFPWWHSEGSNESVLELRVGGRFLLSGAEQDDS